MGCCQGNFFELEYVLDKSQKPTQKLAALLPNFEDVADPAFLTEEAVLQHAEVIAVSAEPNDVQPLTREEIFRVSQRITLHSLRKKQQPRAGPEVVSVSNQFFARALGES